MNELDFKPSYKNMKKSVKQQKHELLIETKVETK